MTMRYEVLVGQRYVEKKQVCLDINNGLDKSSIPPAKQANKQDTDLYEVYEEWMWMLNVSQGNERIEF